MRCDSRLASRSENVWVRPVVDAIGLRRIEIERSGQRLCNAGIAADLEDVVWVGEVMWATELEVSTGPSFGVLGYRP